MDYKEICDRVIVELADKHLVALRDENPEIKALTLVQIQQMEQLQTSLTPEQNRLVEEYIGVENALGFAKTQHIYMAGALDCVKLLKTLGVFG